MSGVSRSLVLAYGLGGLACAAGGDGSPMTGAVTLGAGTSEGTDGAATGSGSWSDELSTGAMAESSEASTGGGVPGCAGPEECASGFCDGGMCRTLATCAELLGESPGLPSGAYEIDPKGTGPYPVWCDMATDGGGWTLVMKLASGTNTFAYDASAWTSEDVVNPDDTMPNMIAVGTNAKLASFNDVPGVSLRLEWIEPNLPGVEFVYDALAGQTALALFSGDEIELAGDESNGCHGSALNDQAGFVSASMRHGKGHQFYGINGEDDSSDNRGAVRFGFGSNDEEGNAWHAKQGIGAQDASLSWKAQDDCNDCGCYGDAYAPADISANLWVR